MIAAVWFNRGADRPATSTLCSVCPKLKSTMTKLSRPILSTLIVLQAVISLFAAVCAQAADKTSEPKAKVDDKSFKCITDMTPVRHFYVDNLLGNVEATVAVATVGKGDYPEGSVLQLMPNEVRSSNSRVSILIPTTGNSSISTSTRFTGGSRRGSTRVI